MSKRNLVQLITVTGFMMLGGAAIAAGQYIAAALAANAAFIATCVPRAPKQLTASS